MDGAVGGGVGAFMPGPVDRGVRGGLLPAAAAAAEDRRPSSMG